MHLGSGIIAGWLIDPIIAFTLLAAYEPIEIFVLSPFLYRRFKIIFGNESWNNALIDIVFNTVGIFIGYNFLRILIEPPFILF